jgi:hypothetical protein
VAIGVGAVVIAAALAAAGYFGLLGAWGSESDTESTEQTAEAPGTPAAPDGPPGEVAVASAAPVVTELFVESRPPGASIMVDGADTGKVTPAGLALATVPTGATIALSLKGYQSATTRVTDANLSDGKKDVTLVPEARAVQLTVTGSYPFELVQGTMVISPSAPTHTLTVQPAGRVTARSREMLLSLPLGFRFDRAQFKTTVPDPGVLAVFSVVETCIVSVDGQELGFPPIPSKPLASGSHTVTLACPDGKGDSQKVTVAPGERAQVAFGPPKDHQR